jgi:hypothetical protein
MLELDQINIISKYTNANIIQSVSEKTGYSFNYVRNVIKTKMMSNTAQVIFAEAKSEIMEQLKSDFLCLKGQ